MFLDRNLGKPIAVQSKEKEHRYIDNYKVRLSGDICHRSFCLIL